MVQSILSVPIPAGHLSFFGGGKLQALQWGLAVHTKTL